MSIYDKDPISADDLLGSFEASLKPSTPEGETFVLSSTGISLTIQVERDLEKPAE